MLKQPVKNLLSIQPLPVTTQRAVLQLQLPIMLLVGTLLVILSWRHPAAASGWLSVELLALLSLVGVWLLQARLPVWLAQAAILLFISMAMWGGVSAGGDVAVAIATGVVTMLMVGLCAGRVVGWAAAMLSSGWLLAALLLFPEARIGAAAPWLVLSVLMVLANITQLRRQIQSQYSAQQHGDLLLGERERLLADFRQSNDNFRRLLEQEAKQKSRQLQRANRELREANAHLESFNYMVSHDIRASLRIVDGLAKVMDEDLQANRPVAAQQNLGRLQSSIGHMRGMVLELLKMAKSGMTAMQCSEVDLSAITRSLVRDLQIAESRRQVVVEIADNMRVRAQPELIREVMQNLLCNAWKFTAQKPDARIQVGVSDEGGNRIYYVRDNGVGIDMSRATELFKPFKRLHAEQGYQGTGVGLASVKRIIERHGGRVWVLAEPGRGTQLCFTLGEQPVTRCEETARLG